MASELEEWEEALLRTYRETCAAHSGHLASLGLSLSEPTLRRWSAEEPSAYGSEIEMGVFRNGEFKDALDVLLCARGRRSEITRAELAAWLERELKRLGSET